MNKNSVLHIITSLILILGIIPSCQAQNSNVGLFFNSGIELFNKETDEKGKTHQEFNPLFNLGIQIEQILLDKFIINAGIGFNSTKRKYSFPIPSNFIWENSGLPEEIDNHSFALHRSFNSNFLNIPLTAGIKWMTFKFKAGVQFIIITNMDERKSYFEGVYRDEISIIPFDTGNIENQSWFSTEITTEFSIQVFARNEFKINYSYNFNEKSYISINSNQRITIGGNLYF